MATYKLIYVSNYRGRAANITRTFKCDPDSNDLDKELERIYHADLVQGSIYVARVS